MSDPTHGTGWPSVAFLALYCCGVWGCVKAPGMDPQVARVGHLILEAEARGALRCAPRELAVARSHLHFSEVEQTQGFSSQAERHLRIADQHAQAARLLSTPEHCQLRAGGRTDGPTP